MKITVQQRDLIKKLSGISSVVPTKTSLPILSTFLLECRGDGKITLTANDLDVSLTTNVECETDGGGSIAIPGKKFFEIIRSLPDDKVVVDIDGDRITIKCKKSRFKMVGKNAEEFPKLPEQKTLASFTMSSETLEDMIAKTSYAVSNDLTRPSLCGVLWEVKAGGLSMVATDGHRLAKVDLPQAVAGVGENEFIVSPKALSILRSSVDGADDVKISVSDNHITFDLGNTVVYSRLLEGPFPDYNQVIPKSNKKRLTVNRDELTDACKRVSILSSVITHQVKMVVGPDKLTMSVNTPDVGEAVEEVPCSYAETKMEIGYNARYLLDILKTMDCDDVTFLLDRNDNAGMVVPDADGEAVQHQCLLMPLRLSD